MANPNPQHNPTDGLGVAAFVQVTGTNLSNRANGGLTVASEATPTDTTGLNGQGIGAVSATPNHPNAQYELVLSLSGATVGGTVYASTCQLTTVLKDVANTTYTPVGSPLYRSESNPSADSPAWYKPSNFAGYTPDVASVSSSGLITALAKGQAVIEIVFATFDNTETAQGEPFENVTNPNDMIYARIVVNVVV
jgi:hypothetical protein